MEFGFFLQESVVDLKEYPNTDFLLVHNPESAVYTDVPPSVLADIVAHKKSVAETILRHELTIERLESLSGVKVICVQNWGFKNQ